MTYQLVQLYGNKLEHPKYPVCHWCKKKGIGKKVLGTVCSSEKKWSEAGAWKMKLSWRPLGSSFCPLVHNVLNILNFVNGFAYYLLSLCDVWTTVTPILIPSCVFFFSSRFPYWLFPFKIPQFATTTVFRVLLNSPDGCRDCPAVPSPHAERWASIGGPLGATGGSGGCMWAQRGRCQLHAGLPVPVPWI